MMKHLILLKFQIWWYHSGRASTSSGQRHYGGGIKNGNISDKELAGELHKTIVRKVEKRKVNYSFIGNLSDAHLADMQLISKYNK